MPNFSIKRGDTSPSLKTFLRNPDGEKEDLNSIQSLKFKMQDPSTEEVIVNSSANVMNADEGKVSYSWTSSDTAEAGHFIGEFEVTWSTGKTETFPNTEYIDIYINEDLSE